MVPVGPHLIPEMHSHSPFLGTSLTDLSTTKNPNSSTCQENTQILEEPKWRWALISSPNKNVATPWAQSQICKHMLHTSLFSYFSHACSLFILHLPLFPRVFPYVLSLWSSVFVRCLHCHFQIVSSLEPETSLSLCFLCTAKLQNCPRCFQTFSGRRGYFTKTKCYGFSSDQL